MAQSPARLILTMAIRALLSTLTLTVLAFSLSYCSSKSNRSNFDDIEVQDAGSDALPQDCALLDSGDLDGPPTADASGYCGNSFYKSIQNPPNIYFVLDRSGSMQDIAAGSTKYSAVTTACVSLVKKLGSRAKVGAAVFPGDPNVDACGPGVEVFSTVLGDEEPTKGAVTKAFAAAINVYPIGGTPVASTLEVIRPTLAALSGKSFVILATDGGPNCNKTTTCSANDCIWNLEGGAINNHQCNASFNCCDPALVPSTDPNSSASYSCLDAAYSIAAVQVLRDAGIRTFVVGIPGSGPYESVLNQLAIVGGTARTTTPRYYRVDDVTKLGATLSVIGEKALVTCEFSLDAAPPEPNLVNVYLDKELLTYDESNGWAWTGAQSLSLRGDACEKLGSGLYKQVQIVAGCPTELPL